MAEWPIYESLAADARAAGCDVTASQVHRWVREQLLPSTGSQVSRGRRGFETQPAEGVLPQLLALCGWRRHTKRHDPLAVLLWFEGWVIPTDRVGRALRAWAPKTRPDISTPAKREELQEQLDLMALRFAPRLKSRFGRRGVPYVEIADAVLPMMQRIAGMKVRVRHRDMDTVERLTGLDRARRDAIGDVGPWLTGRPVEALEPLADLRMTSATELIEKTTDADLVAARPRLRLFLSVGPALAQRLHSAGDAEFAGLHTLGLLAPKDAVLALYVALWLGDVGLGAGLDEFLASVDVLPS